MKKNAALTFLTLFVSILSFAQELPKVKSENHVQIDGTNIFMIPPSSFEISSNFKGFQNPDDQTAMIMVVEIPGPYVEVTKGFKPELLEPRGMDLITKKEIKVAGFDGLLIELDQAANGLVFSKHILVYGNGESTTLINGVFIKDSLTLGESIKESILSSVIDTDIKSNPREALSYTVNEEVGLLKFHSVIGNGMLFNRDLKTPTESADRASLLTDKSFAKIEIENKKWFCISRLKKYPEDYSINLDKGIEEIEIDNLSGFELFAKNNENEDEEMYQVILFDNDGTYYIFVGTYESGNGNASADIKSIIKTFRRKI